jgi:adenine phosphoribosyltransferase
MDLKAYIRDIPDFPEPGILFRDITPLLQTPAAFRCAVDQLRDRYQDEAFDTIVAVESRGFLFGAVLLLDDLLATGGTLAATARLVEMSGGVVAGVGVVIELSGLEGRKRLKGYDVFSLIEY